MDEEVEDEAVMELLYEIKARWIQVTSSEGNEKAYERILALNVDEIRQTLTVLTPLHGVKRKPRCSLFRTSRSTRAGFLFFMAACF